jgi:hypothetical protein
LNYCSARSHVTPQNAQEFTAQVQSATIPSLICFQINELVFLQVLWRKRMSLRTTGRRLFLASAWFMLIELAAASPVEYSPDVILALPLIGILIALIRQSKKLGKLSAIGVVGDAVWLLQAGLAPYAIWILVLASFQLRNLLSGNDFGDEPT